jgi:pimeloyl-ACP methyl ester carboxylesterase
MRMHALAWLAALALAVGEQHAATADAAPAKKALDPKSGGGEVYEAKSADGLVFWWRAPKRYDAAKGCGVTLILHGSGLNHQWGFANHDKATFRPDDLVLSPDGTSTNGEFMGEPKDAKRLHGFLEEVKKAFKVRATFLYGHSQGSFFSLYYAGEFPADVQGVVAHASGMWNWTKTGKEGHHQAIVLMHGTQDPVVPYFQSPGGYEALKEAGYPLLRLFPLEWWNHWPAEHNSAGGTPHTSQELAWAEGMTTTDPERLDACLDMLADVKDKVEHDWGGLYGLAKHVSDCAFAKETTKAKATKAVGVVEALAKKHADGLADVQPGAPLDAKGWAAHLPVFLRQFAGVPACDALAAKWKDTMKKHDEKGGAACDKWWTASHKSSPDVATAFDAGIDAITEGFLTARAQDRIFRESLEGWQKDAKKNKLSKKALKDFAIVETMKDVWKKGWDAYADVCKSAGDV